MQKVCNLWELAVILLWCWQLSLYFQNWGGAWRQSQVCWKRFPSSQDQLSSWPLLPSSPHLQWLSISSLPLLQTPHLQKRQGTGGKDNREDQEISQHSDLKKFYFLPLILVALSCITRGTFDATQNKNILVYMLLLLLMVFVTSASLHEDESRTQWPETSGTYSTYNKLVISLKHC